MLLSHNKDGNTYALASVGFSDENYFTYIVGKNGTGKSELMRSVVQSLMSVDVKFTEYGKIREYDIRDFCNDSIFNEKPKSIIAVSVSSFDKFPIPDSGDVIVNNYHYLGVREGENVGLGKGFLNSNFYSIFSSLGSGTGMLNSVYHVVKYLGFEPLISVKIKIDKDVSIFREALEYEGEEKYSYVFDKVRSGYFYKSNFGDYFGDALDDELEDKKYVLKKIKILVDGFENLFSSGLIADGSFEMCFEEGIQPAILSYTSFDFVLTAIKLGFICAEDIAFKKEGSGAFFSFKQASSGEYSVILSIVGISSRIENGTLILIDEPETCLHPEWQQKYMGLLSGAFSDYKRCHFIIATHSPFIISTSPKNASLLSMENGVNTDISRYIDRSPDYLFARVFKTPGFKNEYIRKSVVMLLVKICEGREFSEDDHELYDFVCSMKNELHQRDNLRKLIDFLREVRNDR